MADLILGQWGRVCPLPGLWLLALAPALSGLVAVPLAPVLAVVEFHLHRMPHTPLLRCRLGGWGECWAGGRRLDRVARQQRREPLGQARLIGIPEGPLHLTATDQHAYVDAGRGLWERRR